MFVAYRLVGESLFKGLKMKIKMLLYSFSKKKKKKKDAVILISWT